MLSTLGLLVIFSAAAAAQGSVTDSVPPTSTRQALEARAAEAERAATSGPENERAARRTEAAALRERLKNGDFQVGDRIALTVLGGAKPLVDTVVVRGGRLLMLPDLPAIPLNGVLHSEIEPYLTTQIGRYIKHPTVQATALIRLGVLGEVRTPGFYWVPTDILVTDAIMQAGGPTGNADVNKTTLERGKKELWSDDSLRAAIVSGRTLDELNVRAGDALVVAEQTKHDFLNILRAGGVVLGLALSIYAISRH